MRRRAQIKKSDSTQTAHIRQQFDAYLAIGELQERLARLENAFENAVAPLDYVAQPFAGFTANWLEH